MKERRELSAGATPEEAIERFPEFDATKHEAVKCAETGIWQVFRIRGKRFDPTIRKPLFRQTAANFRHYRRPVVVGLEAGDVLTFRLKGTRRKYSAPIDKLFGVVLAWEAFAAMNAKRSAKAANRKARQARRSSNL